MLRISAIRSGSSRRSLGFTLLGHRAHLFDMEGPRLDRLRDGRRLDLDEKIPLRETGNAGPRACEVPASPLGIRSRGRYLVDERFYPLFVDPAQAERGEIHYAYI